MSTAGQPRAGLSRREPLRPLSRQERIADRLSRADQRSRDELFQRALAGGLVEQRGKNA